MCGHVWQLLSQMAITTRPMCVGEWKSWSKLNIEYVSEENKQNKIKWNKWKIHQDSFIWANRMDPERAVPFCRRDGERQHAVGFHCALALRPVSCSLQPSSKHLYFKASLLQSWSISALICFNCVPLWFHFTLAVSWKTDLWTCVFVCTSSSFAFAFLIKMNLSF